jgi:hypothetical protein
MALVLSQSQKEGCSHQALTANPSRAHDRNPVQHVKNAAGGSCGAIEHDLNAASALSPTWSARSAPSVQGVHGEATSRL